MNKEPSAEDSEDLDPLSQWTRFLRDYSKGNEWRSPPPPLGSRSKYAPNPAAAPLPAFDVPLYPPGEISKETAQIIAEFYEDYGFLPPPRADEETIRLQTIQEYNLFREDQAENFHRCSSLVNSVFPVAPICTISLFHNAVQVVVSKAGDFPVTLGEELVTETSICGHVVLKKNGELTELVETGTDWRFMGNPWCSVKNNGVRGYVGVPITLQVDPSLHPSDPRYSERVTVGVIALMSNQKFDQLSDTQRKVLEDLSSMLSVQLRSTWEGWRRGKEMRLLNAVTDFLQKSLVEPSQQAILDNTAAVRAEPPVQGSESGRSTPSLRGDVEMLTSGIFANAAEQLQELLEADFAVIVDLSSFHATTNVNGRRKRSHSWVDSPGPMQKRRILGSSSSPAYSDLEPTFDSLEAMTAVARFLDMYFVTGRSVFSGSGGGSGLEEILSSLIPASSSNPPAERGAKAFEGSRTGAVAHLALPFYSANRPNMLIVVASAVPFFTFNPADVTFVSNLGVMLVAHLAQRTIVEADAAKTAFVSQISHELRTPLHGLLGQLDLVRDSFASGELSMVPALLDSAEYCGTALRGIVDDVLDFGKMQSSHDGITPIRPLPTLIDLAQVTLETARSCWLRRLQWQTISAPSGSQFRPEEQSPVELVVEFEDRSTLMNNWLITLDASGFIRILNNLITNSLKYTSEGLITISLVSGLGTDTEGNDTPQITLRVEDTGRGIAPEFLNKLFDPFTQADSFSPGAGLGLHITKSILDRMDGTIAVESRRGGGSIFTVVIPVDGVELAPAGKPRPIRRKFISSERTSRSPELPLSPSQTPPETDKRLGHTPSTTSSTSATHPTGDPATPTSPGTGNEPTATLTSSTSATHPTGDPTTPTSAGTSNKPTATPTSSTSATHPTGDPTTPTSPATGNKPAASTSHPPLQTRAASDEDEPHLKILVVDDNAISRKILVAMLKRLNATTHQADDGINAVEVFREVQPHVVWTDVSMPRMDGVTAAGEMRKIERDLGWSPSHIIAITGLGLSDEHIRREALLGPAALDGWLIKGQNLKALKENLVGVRRKLRGLSPEPAPSC